MTTSVAQDEIVFYSFPTPNGIKVAICLEELGLKCTARRMNILAKENKEDWYLKINPLGNQNDTNVDPLGDTCSDASLLGKIPAITDGDVPVFESNAILLYLTDKYDTEYKISYVQGSKEYYDMLQWLFSQASNAGTSQAYLFYHIVLASFRSDKSKAFHLQETRDAYAVLNNRLMKTPYLAGDKYTIADIATWGWIADHHVVDIDLAEWPALKKWHEEIGKREAVIQGKNMILPLSGSQELKYKWMEMKKKEILAMGNDDVQ